MLIFVWRLVSFIYIPAYPDWTAVHLQCPGVQDCSSTAIRTVLEQCRTASALLQLCHMGSVALHTSVPHCLSTDLTLSFRVGGTAHLLGTAKMLFQATVQETDCSAALHLAVQLIGTAWIGTAESFWWQCLGALQWYCSVMQCPCSPGTADCRQSTHSPALYVHCELGLGSKAMLDWFHGFFTSLFGAA